MSVLQVKIRGDEGHRALQELGGDADDALALALVVKEFLGEPLHGLEAGLGQALHAAVGQLVALGDGHRDVRSLRDQKLGKCRSGCARGFKGGGVVPVAHNGAGALGQQLYVLCGQLPQAAMRDKQQCLFPQRRHKTGVFRLEDGDVVHLRLLQIFRKRCARVQNPAADQIV